MTKVAVALSGGIDSAVVAALMLEAGHDVVGITGKMTCEQDSELVLKNAKCVADKLGIEHYAVDVSTEFNEKVIKYFENSYSLGRTPNPCIMCNKYIKWGRLFDYAVNELGFDYIATGHYAKILEKDGFYKLYPAKDNKKDQLYFLFTLEQEHLAKTLFPLCDYEKNEVRKIAEKYDLPPKSAKESQDICFIKPPLTTKRYLSNVLESRQGDFIERKTGKVLGKHYGFWQFTVGQRKGIGLAAPEALYVLETDARTNSVYVGYKDELQRSNLVLNNFVWNYPNEVSEFEALVKIRYNMNAVKALIKVNKDVVIDFLEPISGIATGQACVLYDINDGHLLGGGFI